MDAHMDGSAAMPAERPQAAGATAAALFPLALAQFIASYAATNMNVAISSIATDLHTDVRGVQTAITLFTLTMAALMIPGSKLTDLWGRKFCFVVGMVVYGLGALLAAVAQGVGLLYVGYSLLEGVGSALMIPPIYILITVAFSDVKSRARWFGIVSAAAGIGAAAGPLIGGVITSAWSWRASFILQVLVVATIIVLSRRIVDPGVQGAKPRFHVTGAILSAVGLIFIVFGIQLSGTYGWFGAQQAFYIGSTEVIPQGGISPVWLFIAIGVLILIGFYFLIQSRERSGKAPLLSSGLFRNRTSNLGLVTQNIQWLIMQGSFFVISVFLQTSLGFSAIQTGLTLTPATIGILFSSGMAQRMAARRSQRLLVSGGFVVTMLGMVLLLVLTPGASSAAIFIPGLLFMGLGIGIMLTASVNVVQSAFPEKYQGEISGLSRSVSNLGSSLGTAFVGSLLVAELLPGNQNYLLALGMMVVFSGIGLVAALLLPSQKPAPQAAPAAQAQ